MGALAIATAAAPSYIVTAISLKSAAKHGCRSAYLARLGGSSLAVTRDFASKRKHGANGNRQAFSLDARPGDLFEARRFAWNADRREFSGGTVYFGVTSAFEIAPLTRSEALASLDMPRLPAGAPDVSIRAERMPLEGIHIDRRP